MQDPTLKRLKRIAQNSKLLAAAVAQLSADIDRENVVDVQPRLVRQYADAWTTHTEALANATTSWFPITRRLDAIARQARDARSTSADMAEATADAVMITEQVTEGLRLAYFPLARHILVMMPDLLEAVVREVASHGGGGRQLELLRDAINEVLSPAEV